MTFSRITDTDPVWHLTAMVVSAVLLVLTITNTQVRWYRIRRNLPTLTGWIVIGQLLQMLGTMWLLGYFAWALFMIL